MDGLQPSAVPHGQLNCNCMLETSSDTSYNEGTHRAQNHDISLSCTRILLFCYEFQNIFNALCLRQPAEHSPLGMSHSYRRM